MVFSYLVGPKHRRLLTDATVGEMPGNAASPAIAARVRRASARQPGFAGFALAPARRDAAGGWGLPEK
jgi:hypothetical protein